MSLSPIVRLARLQVRYSTSDKHQTISTLIKKYVDDEEEELAANKSASEKVNNL